jgi:pantoate--beta-alanine ligase
MPTEITSSIAALRARLEPVRRAGAAIGFVPTMGALHDGHASLIQRAREDCGHVVVSIFVNPLQFDRREDLQGYPRTMDADLALCASLGVETVFAPREGEMYPRPPACTVDVGGMADHLCGRYRPGHFRGVATVVLKLFQIVQANRAYFGEKDAQQLAIIRRLVSDFNIPVVIVGMPTVREADGLALSSRNRRLSPEERKEAPVLFRALDAARSRIEGGERDANAIRRHAVALVPSHRTLEYFEIVDPETMQPVTRVDGPVLVAGAIWIGSTRLIDNAPATPPE